MTRFVHIFLAEALDNEDSRERRRLVSYLLEFKTAFLVQFIIVDGGNCLLHVDSQVGLSRDVAGPTPL
jgi:hypothetical protein